MENESPDPSASPHKLHLARPVHQETAQIPAALAERFRMPEPDPPWYRQPAWWKKFASSAASVLILVALLVGGFLYIRSTRARHQAEELAARRAREESARAEALADAARARERAQADQKRRAEEEARVAAERARSEKESRERLAAQEAARRRNAEFAARRDEYQDLLRRFQTAPVDRLGRAPAAARPDAAAPGAAFHCYLADSSGEGGLYRYEIASNAPPRITRLDREKPPEEVPAGDFFRRLSTAPCLFMAPEKTVWLSLPRARSGASSSAPPSEGGFNPGRQELGPLYRFIVQDNPSRASRLCYVAAFDHAEAGIHLTWNLRADEELTRSTIADRVRQIVDARISRNAQTASMKITKAKPRRKPAGLYNGSDLVKQKLDGTETPEHRDRHGVNQYETSDFYYKRETHWKERQAEQQAKALEAEAAEQETPARSVPLRATSAQIDSLVSAGRLTFAPAPPPPGN